MDPLAAFAPCSSSSESEDEAEPAPTPARPRVSLESFARETLGFDYDHMKLPPYATMRSRSHREAFTERINGLDTGFCDRDRQSERDKRRADASALSSKSAFILSVLEDIGKDLTERGLNKETDLPTFISAFKEIAVRQLRSAKDENLLKNNGKDLYIMAGMMLGIFRGDEEFRAGPIGGQVQGFVFRNFYVDAEEFLLNESIKKRDDEQSTRKRKAEEEAEERKKRELEEALEHEKAMEEEQDRELCAMLERMYFDQDKYIEYRRDYGLDHDTAMTRCWDAAREKRIAVEADRERVAVSSPPRSVVDPDEEREIELVEDEYANLSLHPGASEDDYANVLVKPEPAEEEDEDANLPDDSEPAEDESADLPYYSEPADDEYANRPVPAEPNRQDARPSGPTALELQGMALVGRLVGTALPQPQGDDDMDISFDEGDVREQRPLRYGGVDLTEDEIETAARAIQRAYVPREQPDAQGDYDGYRPQDRDYRQDYGQAAPQNLSQRIADQYDRQQRAGYDQPLHAYDARLYGHQEVLPNGQPVDQDAARSSYSAYDLLYVPGHGKDKSNGSQRVVSQLDLQEQPSHVQPVPAFNAQLYQENAGNGQPADSSRNSVSPFDLQELPSHIQPVPAFAPGLYGCKENAINGQAAAQKSAHRAADPRKDHRNRHRDQDRGRDQVRNRDGQHKQPGAPTDPRLRRDQKDGQPVVQKSHRVADPRQSRRDEYQERAGYDQPEYEEPQQGYGSPQYAASPTYGAGSPNYEATSPNYDAVPYGQQEESIADYEARMAADLRRMQMEMQQDPRLRARYADPVPPRSVSRDHGYVDEQRMYEYGHGQQRHSEPMQDDDVELVDVVAVAELTREISENLKPYAQRLTRKQMKKMYEDRISAEKQRLSQPGRVLPKIDWCGQGMMEQTENRPALGDDFPGACKTVRPRVIAKLGHRPFIPKSILRIPRVGRPPVLLTDMQADKIRFPATEAGKKQQAELVRLQRYRAQNPPKTVRFADENDERNKIRCYIMQAVQQDCNRKGTSHDNTDDDLRVYYEDHQLSWLQHLLKYACDNHDSNFFARPYATLEGRECKASATFRGAVKKDDRFRAGRKHYQHTPLALRVTRDKDPIFTRESANMRRDALNRYPVFSVSHREYKILEAIKPMQNDEIKKWLAELKLYVTHAFECGNAIGTRHAANSGLSYLVFGDSLLDRVNTHRFPQAYFCIHRKPMRLSSSFRTLCDDVEVPLEKLLNIEYFVFAYGFDEIAFEGQEPWVVAETVLQHCIALAKLVMKAREVFRNSHRCTIEPKFRVMKLPTLGMDKEIIKRHTAFNEYLCQTVTYFYDSLQEAGKLQHRPDFPLKLMDWENKEILARTKIDASRDLEKCSDRSEYRYNCIDSFAVVMQLNLGMRVRSPMPSETDQFYEFHERRKQVSGLSTTVLRSQVVQRKK